MLEDVVRVRQRSKRSTQVVLCAEHASDKLVGRWAKGLGMNAWPIADEWLQGTHWMVDIGTETLTEELASRLDCTAVICQFSRLLCDANRPKDSATMFRPVCEGDKPVRLNVGLTEEEKEERLRMLWVPYHDTLERVMQLEHPKLLFSVHSFTPLYEGQRRTVELGVIFNDEDELATRLIQHLVLAGYNAQGNVPWSGKLGMMFSPDSHARSAHAQTLLLEVRQDLIVDDKWRARLVDILVKFLSQFGLQVG